MSSDKSSKDAIYAEFATDTQPSSSPLQRIWDQLNPANHSILENVLAVLLIVLFAVVILLAVTRPGSVVQPPSAACSSVMCLDRAALTVSMQDKSAKPCSNFHSFVCGKYKNFNRLTAAQLERTVFGELTRGNRDRIEVILQSPIERNERSSYERKIKTFFQRCNDDFETEKLKGIPLALLLQSDFHVLNASSVDGFELNAMLQNSYGSLHAPVLFEILATPNFLDGDKLILSLNSGGIGMSSGLYFGSHHQPVIDAYKQYMRTVALELANDYKITDDGVRNRVNMFADDVVEIETQLANFSRTSSPPEGPPLDPKNLKSLTELDRMYSPIAFTQFFRLAYNNKVDGNTRLAVQAPEYLSKVLDYINNKLPLLYPTDYKRKLSNYMNWRVMQMYTGDLSSSYVHARRTFQASLSFRPYKYESRFDYCFRRAEQFMQKGLSAMFVKGHLLNHSRSAVDEIYKDIQQHMVSSIDRIDWFTAEERAKAKVKVQALRDRIGYFAAEISDYYLDNFYDKLNVQDDDYTMEISISWLTVARNRLADSLGKVPDRNVWDGSTYDVNVHLNNPNVEITVPAGILQWPIFTSRDPKYLAYASIGAMMAAELIKGIDSGGQFFDENGLQSLWWSTETLLRYTSASNCTVNYFSGMRAGPYIGSDGQQLFVNIASIIGPNTRNLLAAIDGLRLARGAYRQKFGDSELPLPFAGMNVEQHMFVAWAQNYCYNRDGQYSYNRAVQNERLPEETMVNGAVSLLPEFNAAFGCRPAQANAGCKRLFYN